MKQGKEIKQYNNVWLQNKHSGRRNACSPLCFSIVFNDPVFIDTYLEYKKEDIGMSIPDEDLLVSIFSQLRYDTQLSVCSIFETNGKFSISRSIFVDILEDTPDVDECYVYFVSMLMQSGGFHRTAILRTKDNFYVVDSNNTHILVYEVDEFLLTFHFPRVSNLSVLLDTNKNSPITYKFQNGYVRYKTNEFSHII